MNEELIKGGCGRSASDVESYAKISLWCFLAMGFVVLVAVMMLVKFE